LCFLAGLSRWGYYKSLKNSDKQDAEEARLVEMVQDVRRSMPRLGGRKLYHLLSEQLNSLVRKPGRDKFFDFLKRYGLLVKRKRKNAYTTQSHHHFYKYSNRLKSKQLTAPNQAYVSDITYLRTRQGFVYLFVQTDAFSRLITGWHLSKSLSIEGAVRALKMTLKQCPAPAGVIHHSDRGIQYCSKAYVKELQSRGMEISMTEENHCYENAIAERINGILKQEFLLDTEFKDFSTAYRAVKQAVHAYNVKRPHYALNLCTPQKVHNAA
jgi:transposase InsO family protein